MEVSSIDECPYCGYKYVRCDEVWHKSKTFIDVWFICESHTCERKWLVRYEPTRVDGFELEIVE